MSVKVVVFDVGHVILRIGWEDVISKLSSRLVPAQEIPSQIANSPLYDQYERGHLSCDRFFQAICGHFELNHEPKELQSMWKEILLEPYVHVERAIHMLHKKQIKIYALSNTNQSHSSEFIQKYPLFDLFTRVFTSHELMSRKPEIEIYQKTHDQLGCENKEVVFFDDRIENINAADRFGWNAHLIGRPDVEVPQILSRYGLIRGDL